MSESIRSSNLLINLSFLFDQPTGISIYATNVFPYLKSLDPTLLTAKNHEQYHNYIIPQNLTPAQGTKGHLQRLIWTQFQLPEISQKLRSQLLFSPVPEAPLFSKCRSVVMVHDLIPLRFPKRFSPLNPYFRYYIPAVLNQAEHIICNSLSTARDITQFYGISARKITPILLAYNANHFYPLKPQREYIQQKNQQEEKIPYYLYIGRHDPHKNLHRLVKAFAAIPNCKDYQLWLVGSSDRRYTPKLKQDIQELAITPQVKFLNYVPYEDLPRIINQSMALVFPSLWEGFGFPVLEAMGCATPVITSNLSSLPEVAGDAAILINPYQTSEITAAMINIAKDYQLQKHLSDLGKQQASKFSWQTTGQETLAILQKYL